MNITVVGGGTIGWMSALFLKKRYPNYNVTIIESTQIGVIGVGESTTTPFLPFLREIDLDLNDLMKTTGATFKTGTKFTNWSKNKGHYFSVMTPWHPSLLPSSYSSTANANELFFSHLVASDTPITITGAPKLASLNKSPFYIANNQETPYTYHSVHIDGVKTSEYFRNFSKNKGITVVDNIVSHFENNDSGEIFKILFKDGTSISTDFVFDCTGFAKLGLHKHYKAEWESYNKWLSVNSTITCMIPNNSDIPTYTECIAMKYGWMFKVPMKDRFGTGYNFDSNYITKEEAQKEMEEYYGRELNILKHVTYDAGHYKQTWIKNCVGLGLSSGFIEPMAGSNIAIANEIVKLTDLSRYFNKDYAVVDEVNSAFTRINETFLCNIYFRYLTTRDDTAFWKTFYEKEMPLRLKLAITQFKQDKDLFKFATSLEQHPVIWLAAIQGIGHKEYLDIIKEFNQNHPLDDFNIIKSNIDKVTNFLEAATISHRNFIEQHLD